MKTKILNSKNAVFFTESAFIDINFITNNNFFITSDKNTNHLILTLKKGGNYFPAIFEKKYGYTKFKGTESFNIRVIPIGIQNLNKHYILYQLILN